MKFDYTLWYRFFFAWRCIACGEIIDETIVENRRSTVEKGGGLMNPAHLHIALNHVPGIQPTFPVSGLSISNRSVVLQ